MSSQSEGLTGRDLLQRLRATACPRPDCDGQVRENEYKGTEALVCESCSTPTLRLWGER